MYLHATVCFHSICKIETTSILVSDIYKTSLYLFTWFFFRKIMSLFPICIPTVIRIHIIKIFLLDNYGWITRLKRFFFHLVFFFHRILSAGDKKQHKNIFSFIFFYGKLLGAVWNSLFEIYFIVHLWNI